MYSHFGVVYSLYHDHVFITHCICTYLHMHSEVMLCVHIITGHYRVYHVMSTLTFIVADTSTSINFP